MVNILVLLRARPDQPEADVVLVSSTLTNVSWGLPGRRMMNKVVMLVRTRLDRRKADVVLV